MNSLIETDRFSARFLHPRLSSCPRKHVNFDNDLEGLRAINQAFCALRIAYALRVFLGGALRQELDALFWPRH